MATTGVFSDNPTVFDEFEFIDGDGDGVITKQELTPFASQGGGHTQKEIDDAFTLVDTDQSGTLGVLEYLAVNIALEAAEILADPVKLKAKAMRELDEANLQENGNQPQLTD